MKNKPAFPRPYSNDDHQHGYFDDQEGMTLLEYYAGQALVGLWASHSHPQSDSPLSAKFDGFSKACFDQAESMIKEAEKRN